MSKKELELMKFSNFGLLFLIGIAVIYQAVTTNDIAILKLFIIALIGSTILAFLVKYFVFDNNNFDNKDEQIKNNKNLTQKGNR